MASSSSKKDVIRRKLVIVGDGACGKTSLLSVFTLGYFPKVRCTFLVLLASVQYLNLVIPLSLITKYFLLYYYLI